MNEATKAKQQANLITAKDIASYLQRYQEVLLDIKVPHVSGEAIPLAEKQIRRYRKRTRNFVGKCMN